jgi:hypothetical protein
MSDLVPSGLFAKDGSPAFLAGELVAVEKSPAAGLTKSGSELITPIPFVAVKPSAIL